MIDFHTHLLPKLDDGSGSVAESVSILEAMATQGITKAIATPHFDMERENIQKFIKHRSAAAEHLAKSSPDSPRVILGAEIMDRGLPLAKVDEIDALCIEGTRLLLIETELKKWDKSFYFNLLELIYDRNIIPVLAHIERVYFIGKNREMIRALHQEGVLLQMNAESFLQRIIRRKTLSVFQKEGVDFLGSDCHGIDKRPPNLGKALAVIEKCLGEDAILSLKRREQRFFSED